MSTECFIVRRLQDHRLVKLQTLAVTLQLLAASCSVSSSARGPSEISPALATRTTVAEGIGTTRVSAIADARIEAIRSVIGAFVAAGSTVVNDQLVESHFLSLSDGYIAQSTILSEWRDSDGYYHVQLHAVVVDDAISELFLRDKDVPKPATTDAAGAEETRRKRTEDATALLSDTLERSNFPLGIFEADPSRSTIRHDGDGATITIDCTVRVNRPRWNDLLKRMSRCLAALGAMDSPIRWRSRSIGGRIKDLEARPIMVGKFLGNPLNARLTGASEPLRLGPLDSL
jgi:hypothetical protein